MSASRLTDPSGTSQFDSFPRGATVPFPYAMPYPQQVALMDALLDSLVQPSVSRERCRVIMLESPTGTGKSLSLACASMAWLRHVEECDLRAADNSNSSNTASSGVDWVDAFVPPQERERAALLEEVRKTAQQTRSSLSKELEIIRAKLTSGEGELGRNNSKRVQVLRAALVDAKQASRNNGAKRKRTGSEQERQQEETGVEFALAAYHSDGEQEQDNLDSEGRTTEMKPAASRAARLLDGSALDGSNAFRNQQITSNTPLAVTPLGQVKPSSGVRKIIYSARTHTQLSQFVSELRRTAWGQTIRVVALGGRKAMCGNREVLAKYKNNESALNDACLDMKKSKATNCPLLSNTAAVETLALHTLAQPTDIEEAAFLGSTMQTCAYYASRSALAAAEVIVMPYSMLLSPQTRESIGLSLEQAFVIVDEAHNLPEALRALHTSRLSLPVVKSAMEQLTLYIAKYVDRLAGRNLHYLGQLKRILKQIEKYLLRPADKLKQTSMMTADELLIELRLVNVNLFKILRYLQQTRLAQKLLGFTQYRMSQQQSSQNITDGATKELIRDDGLSKHVSAMSVVQIFLEKLACSSYEGKITIEVPDENDSRVKHPGLRYVLLNPAVFFDNVLKEACALALVGGTLRPFVHMAAELLGVEQGADVLCDAATADEQMARTAGRVSSSFVSPTFTAFTCDHVVSPSNVLLQCVSTGPTGQTLDFRHQQRSTIAVCDELGRTLVEICRTVPNGFVVFLPSYSYEEFLVSRWKKTGAWKTLQSIKRIHREPKTTQNIEASLEAYAADASTENGALLFSVIGGKLSEGINFSNEMARCVAVTGLPYPDITDTELKEKMASMDRASTKSITGQAFYHNLCMRAINQSVGRAIRHANDFAAIILLDRRYQTDNRVWDGIPNWLKKSVVDGDWRKDIPLSQRLDNMKTFFQTHKS